MAGRYFGPMLLVCAFFGPAPVRGQSVQSAGLKTDDVRAEKAFAEAQAAVKAERWNDALEGFTTAILYRQDYVEAHRARA